MTRYALTAIWLLSLPGCGFLTDPENDDGTCPQTYALPEEVQLRLTLWLPLPGDADTDTVTVVAKILDDSGPIVVGVPLPLVAVDSARHAVRFARVGERPPVDTVRLNVSGVSGQ